MILAGGLAWLGVEAALRLTAVMALAAVPLLENHTLLAGYGESWIAGVLLLSAIVMCAAVVRNSALLICIGIVIAAVSVAVKNSGAFYFFALLIPIGCLFLKQRGFGFNRQALLLSGTTICCLLTYQEAPSVVMDPKFGSINNDVWFPESEVCARISETRALFKYRYQKRPDLPAVLDGAKVLKFSRESGGTDTSCSAPIRSELTKGVISGKVILQSNGERKVVAVLYPKSHGFQFLGGRIALRAGERAVLSLAGKDLVIALSSWNAVIWNKVISVFVNSSFGALGLFVCISVLQFCHSRSFGFSSVQLSSGMAVLCSSGLILFVLMLFDVYTLYGSEYSRWGADTGGSRFLLPVTSIVVLAAMLIQSAVSSFEMQAPDAE